MSEIENKNEKTKAEEVFSEKVTRLIGSTGSLVVHTILFAGAIGLIFFGVSTDSVLLVLTTIVSLEAIYLSIFIQITVNRHAESLEDVEEDLDEIQEDVKEISEDVDEISKDIDEIQEDVDEISKDIDEIQEDVDEIQEHDEEEEKASFDKIETLLKKAVEDLERLKKQQ